MKNEIALFKLDDVQTVEKAELEKVIASGIQTFRDVGEALATIRAKKLYADEFETFEEYVQNKWDIGARRAYQLMGANAVARTCEQIVQIPNEGVARQLSKLPKVTQIAVAKVLAKSPKKITAKVAEEAVHRVARGGLAAAAIAERSNHAQPEIDLNLKPKMTPISRAQAAATVSEWWEANKTRCLGYPAVPTQQVVQQIIALFS